MSMDVVFQQVLIIFCYVFVGWVACKMGVLDGTLNKKISDLIVKITLPLSIIAAANVQPSANDLRNMALTAIILIASYIAGAIALCTYAKVKGLSPAKRAVYSGLCVFPNSGFIGIPLCTALMGDIGTLYGAAGLIAFNSMFFTYQYMLFMPNEKIRFKLFATPLNACVVILVGMLAFGINLPTVPQTVVSNLGAMTTPLALMIVGTMLAEGDILSVIRCKAAYLLSLMRNIVLPGLLLVVLAFLPLDYEMKLATIIYAACPCANLTAVFAIQADMETELCAKTILLSTLFFMGTLPVILCLAQLIFM